MLGSQRPPMSHVRPPSKETIRRAAEAVIRMYGTDALGKAADHVRVFNSRGFYSLAAGWKFIEEEIQRLQRKNTAQPKHGKAINEAIKEVA